MWAQTPPSSVSSCTSARSKASFSDLRKTLFSGNSLSLSTQELCRGASSTLKHRLSQNSLKQKSSQSSLQTKTSHTSLKKFRRGSNTDESPQISLPVPDEASRDKIRIKLKHSASLLSIDHGGTPFGNPIIAESNRYDEAILEQILNLCKVKIVQDYAALPENLEKISENRVYLNPKDKTIYKIMPISSTDEISSGRDMSLKEAQLHCILNGTKGFVSVLECGLFEKADSKSRYIVLHMKNHGTALSKVKSFKPSEASEILKSIFQIMYEGELKFQFEHRCLTLDHILLDKAGNVTICDYQLSRATDGSNCWFTRLDHPMFFQGRKDYNYILQWMRYLMSSNTWHLHHPRTNLYWAYYVMDRVMSRTNNSPEKPKLLKLHSNLDPLKRRRLWKRGESSIDSCRDLLAQMS